MPDYSERTSSDKLRLWLPTILGAFAYLILLLNGVRLLNDSDIYWHIAVGQWIIENRALPHADPFSFTMRGEPWITSAWLSEVLYFCAFKLAGWTGPVICAALSVAASLFLLTHLLLKKLPTLAVIILAGGSMAIATPHVLARPHVLVFPILVLWTYGIVNAAEQQRAPRLRYLPLICLWANFHGSFTLGLALIAPFALEAIYNQRNGAQVALAGQWLRFGILAIFAAVLTPYGPESLVVTVRLLSLGSTLSRINEWQPEDFGTWGPLEVYLLGGIAYLLYSGFKLTPLRIAVLLIILHETLAHRRYADVMAFVSPFVIASPLARHLSGLVQPNQARQLQFRCLIVVIAALVILTAAITARKEYYPRLTPTDAVNKIEEYHADRILNDYYFGGYLIYRGLSTFIDSRAELFGSDFLLRFHRAINLQDPGVFVQLLDQYRVDATLLFPSDPAVGLLDHLEGWERIHSDNIAIVHHRQKKRE